MQNNAILSIEPIEKLRALQYLIISHNPIQKISLSNQLLEELTADHCEIREMYFTGMANNLKSVNVSFNNLQSITQLLDVQNLKALKRLDLSGNKVIETDNFAAQISIITQSSQV